VTSQRPEVTFDSRVPAETTNAHIDGIAALVFCVSARLAPTPCR